MNWPIISTGVVCAGGIGKDALLQQWKVSATLNAAGTKEYETYLVDKVASGLTRWQKLARLRRASAISCYLTEAAEQALSAVPSMDRQKTGVVAALFLGCLDYSIRFYKQLTNDGRRFASPILFPETVFNSPLSHVVSTLGIGGPVYSQIGDSSSWATALRTAHCWLAKGRVENVLVLGAEEFNPHELDAFEAVGFFRQSMVVGEGAGAILLSRSGEEVGGVSLTQIADGYAFHSKRAAVKAAECCLEEFSSEVPVVSTGVGWMQKIEKEISQHRKLFNIGHQNLSLSGTAGCAWDTILAADYLKNSNAPTELVVPFYGLSNQCAAVKLTRSVG